MRCREKRSSWEYTDTVRMPSSLAARMTRMAISPRFATRRLLIGRDADIATDPGRRSNDRLPHHTVLYPRNNRPGTPRPGAGKKRVSAVRTSARDDHGAL